MLYSLNISSPITFKILALALLFLTANEYYWPVNAAVSDALFFQIEHPDTLQYVFEFVPSYHIGGRFPDRPITGYMVYADPPEACEPLTNYLDVEKNVVLIERGGCAFVDKALHAEQAGARIAIVTDSKNGSDGFIDMIQDETGRRARLPVGYLPGNNGRRMRDFLNYEGDYIRLKIPLNLTAKALRDVLNKPPWELW